MLALLGTAIGLLVAMALTVWTLAPHRAQSAPNTQSRASPRQDPETHPAQAFLDGNSRYPPPLPQASPVAAGQEPANSGTLPVPLEQRLVVSAMAPPGKMYLKIRRSQRATMITSKAVFILDARVDLSSEDDALVRKYSLLSTVIYDSKERLAHQQASYDQFSLQQALAYVSPGKALWKGTKGLWSAARMALSLRVTVKSLMAGQHIECRDLNELLGAENAIREACQTLRTYLDIAATFDGKEELVEI
jgi:hypothetical protein